MEEKKLREEQEIRDAAAGTDAVEATAEAEAAEAEATAETEAAETTNQPEPLKDIDMEWEAEKICRWGAARASVIVVAPLLGSMALIANEVYMITRLADLRGVTLSEGAAMGLLGSLGATFVGQSVATIIPMPALQVPLAISITYGVGKAANAWLKAGVRKMWPRSAKSMKRPARKGRTTRTRSAAWIAATARWATSRRNSTWTP